MYGDLYCCAHVDVHDFFLNYFKTSCAENNTSFNFQNDEENNDGEDVHLPPREDCDSDSDEDGQSSSGDSHSTGGNEVGSTF